MKKSLLHRVSAFLLFISMLIAMTACGGEDTNDDDDSQNQSFDTSYMKIPDEVTNISRFLIRGDTAYFCCEEIEDDEKGAISYVATMSMESGDFEKLSLDTADELIDIAIDSDNNIWVLCQSDSEIYTLTQFDSGGAVLQSTDVSDVFDSDIVFASDTLPFLSLDADGNICVAVKYGNITYAYMFDNQGKFLFDLSADGKLLTTVTTAEGEIGICSTTDDLMTYNLLIVYADNEDWSEDTISSGAASGLYGGVTHSVYLNDSSYLYGVDTVSGEKKKVFSWSDTGLSARTPLKK